MGQHTTAITMVYGQYAFPARNEVDQSIRVPQQMIPPAHLLGHYLPGVRLDLQQCKHLLHNCFTVSALLISQLVATGDSRP